MLESVLTRASGNSSFFRVLMSVASKPQNQSLHTYEFCLTFCGLILVAPWFEQKGEKEVVRKTGENATLECNARGFPLNVEWKSKSGVLSCNGTFLSLDKLLDFYQLRVHCKIKRSLFLFIFTVERLLQPTNQPLAS